MNSDRVHSLVFQSPIGALRIIERDGHLVSLDWQTDAARSPTAETPLLLRARDALDAYFAGRISDFDLPCAPNGTPYQTRVWAEMARIPYGATVSYGELARRIESSARAVGNACGANPLPIIVPCHRVLAAGGALGGYSGFGGANTKRWLLALETRSRNSARDPRELTLSGSSGTMRP